MNTPRLQILNALFFAALMLVMASFFPKEYGIMINNFLIAAWFLVSAHLSGKGNRKCHKKNNSNKDAVDN